MKSFEEISKMNLADIGEPEEETMETFVEEEVTEEAQPQMMKISEESTQTSEDEVEVIGEVKKMREPVGEHYYIDAKLTEKEFVSFLFAHNYRQPMILIASIIAIAWPIMAFVRQDSNLLFALAMAAIVILFLPFSTWTRGKKAINSNPLYKETFHFMLDEWGVHLELGDQAVDVEWSKVQKCVFLKSVTALYTNKINAHLIPTNAMGNQVQEINQFIKRMKNR